MRSTTSCARSFDDAGGNVPRIPPHRAGGGIYYRDVNWFARVGFLHAFDQNQIGENETPTEGYTLLNADLAYTFKLDPQLGVVPEMTIGLKGAQPARRRRAQPRLVQEGRGAGARPHHPPVRHHQAQLIGVRSPGGANIASHNADLP